MILAKSEFPKFNLRSFGSHSEILCEVQTLLTIWIYNHVQDVSTLH